MRILFFISLLMAALSLSSQTTNHSSIRSIDVSYVQANLIEQDSLNSVYMRSAIVLWADTVITTLHFKVLDSETNSVVYEVSYALADTVIYNTVGDVLYRKEADTVYINSPETIPLNVYKYEIVTGNASGDVSNPYIEYQ